MKRNFMCTINFNQKIDPLSVLPDFTIYKGIKRATFQLERGEVNQRIHWQVFLEFMYPVSPESIIKSTAEQRLKMHVDKGTAKGLHPKAGRNYCTKGEALDEHRYIWSKDTGWENNKKPTIIIQPSGMTKEEFNTREGKMKCLIDDIKKLQEFIREKSVERGNIKII